MRTRLAKYLLAVVLLVLPVVSWVAVAHAQSFRSGHNVTVARGQTVNNTLFVAGRNVNIEGNVNGDVFCAGENVTVSGRVHGDVVCAGQDVTVNGLVTGDVRLAGQDVTLGGVVNGNATIAGETFLQQSRGAVGRDITVGSSDATLNGSVGRDVAAGSGTLIINNSVGRNVQANVTHLTLQNGAKVTGNVTYTSNNTLSRSGGAQVGGTVTHHTPTQQKHHIPLFVGWALALYTYVTFIITSLVLVLLAPGLFERALVATKRRLGMTFLVGLISSIVVPILLTVLLVTVVGLPLGLLGSLMWLLAVLLAGPFAAYLLGRWILRAHGNAILAMLVGAAILYLLYLLPFVGWVFWLVGTWFGLGALLHLARGLGRPQYRIAESSSATTGDSSTS